MQKIVYSQQIRTWNINHFLLMESLARIICPKGHLSDQPWSAPVTDQVEISTNFLMHLRHLNRVIRVFLSRDPTVVTETKNLEWK